MDFAEITSKNTTEKEQAWQSVSRREWYPHSVSFPSHVSRPEPCKDLGEEGLRGMR
jgi:hypothetical protein